MLALLRHRYLRSKAYPGVVVAPPSVSCHVCITSIETVTRSAVGEVVVAAAGRLPPAWQRGGRRPRGAVLSGGGAPAGSTAGRRSHRPPLTSLHITLGNEKSSPPLSGDTNLSGALVSASILSDRGKFSASWRKTPTIYRYNRYSHQQGCGFGVETGAEWV